MALAGAKLFVEEGTHVFIQARRQEALDVTAVQGEAAELDDLDRLYDTVKREKGSIDVLWASAAMGEPASSARSPTNSSTAPSGSTRAAPCSPEQRDRKIRVNVLTPARS